MWGFQLTTGALRNPSATVVGYGYSGNGADLDNPAGQGDRDHGPIPQGLWMIGEFFDDPGDKGLIVSRLTPVEEKDALGRTGFMIHGDNQKLNHTASDGCIILNHGLRAMIAASSDDVLLVTA